MLMISVHEGTKTIGEEDHCQGMDDREASGQPWETVIIHDNEQIGRSNEQKDHKGQLHEYLTDYPNHPFVIIYFSVCEGSEAPFHVNTLIYFSQ